MSRDRSAESEECSCFALPGRFCARACCGTNANRVRNYALDQGTHKSRFTDRSNRLSLQLDSSASSQSNSWSCTVAGACLTIAARLRAQAEHDAKIASDSRREELASNADPTALTSTHWIKYV